MNTNTPERLTDAYLDRLMPKTAARRAEAAKAAIGSFLAGQRKKLNPPPRTRQVSLFGPTTDPRLTTQRK